MILIAGSPDSGKSELAEKLMTLLDAKLKYYIATMIPYGEEGKKRVEKHRRLRAGKGFITIEKATDVDEVSEGYSLCDSACLLECISNLSGNEIYKDGHDSWSDDELIEHIVSEVVHLNDICRYLVVVTNYFSELSMEYDEETVRYITICNKVNDRLIAVAREVYRLVEGEWKHYENF